MGTTSARVRSRQDSARRPSLAQCANGRSLHPARDVLLLDDLETSARDARSRSSSRNATAIVFALRPVATSLAPMPCICNAFVRSSRVTLLQVVRSKRTADRRSGARSWIEATAGARHGFLVSSHGCWPDPRAAVGETRDWAAAAGASCFGSNPGTWIGPSTIDSRPRSHASPRMLPAARRS
jgi:hypothetical protein